MNIKTIALIGGGVLVAAGAAVGIVKYKKKKAEKSETEETSKEQAIINSDKTSENEVELIKRKQNALDKSVRQLREDLTEDVKSIQKQLEIAIDLVQKSSKEEQVIESK